MSKKPSTDLKQIVIYTDGSCLNNPGPGGWGVVLLYGDHRRELSGGFRETTNNRMELMAAISGLEALKEKCRVTLYSDSQYVVKGMAQGWARRWQANGWKRNKREKAISPDLWERLLNLAENHEIEFKWVRGHAGIPENERCDELALEAAQDNDLPIDGGYQGNLT